MDKENIAFDPTKIDAPTILNKNSELIIKNLLEFDSLSSVNLSFKNMIKPSILSFLYGSNWYGKVYEMEDSINNTIQDLIKNSIHKKLQPAMLSFFKPDALNFESYVRTSIQNSLIASIVYDLSEKQYNSIFNSHESGESYSFKKYIKLFKKYQYFNSLGLFPNMTIFTDLYLLASWKDPQNIQIIMIKNEI